MTLEKYINLFFSLFHTGIPLNVFLISCLCGTIASIYILKSVQDNRNILLVWIVTYLFLMLYSTVLGRLHSVKEFSEVHLMPFWSLEAIWCGSTETIYEKIYNVLFFIPLGVLICLYFRHRFILIALFVGFAISLSIELLQLLTKTGTSETDDVICNMVGCVLGALISSRLVKIKQA